MPCRDLSKLGNDMETYLGSSSGDMGTPTRSDAEGGLPLGKGLVLGVKCGELLGGLLISQLITCRTRQLVSKIPLIYEAKRVIIGARLHACADRWDRAQAVD